ncbi:glycosyltransferase [Chlorobium sp. N1]|uniref:glycosyltransferase n=1 Tax=Chlorobium sp. N1 TaxID=2491138 RepID=UPI0013F1736D|nr:glycosyltransferase [Chlorobium sp. N1]
MNKARALGGNDEPVKATLFLITYNQERFIREAIQGAFAQTYSPLEIVISDDASTDDTFRIVQELCATYSGPHRVRHNRNPVNLGLIRHINRITALSSGELIVYAAGDDVSLAVRTEKMVERYLASGRRATLIHSSVSLMCEGGAIEGIRVPPIIEGGMGLAEMAESGALIIGATVAFTKQIEGVFGPITHERCIEDLVMGFRSALIGGIEYIDEPLVLYRHEGGLTAQSIQRTTSFDDFVTRKLRGVDGYLAVLMQRMDDLRLMGNVQLLERVRMKRSAMLLSRKVLSGSFPFFKLAAYAHKRGQLAVFFRSWVRRLKWRGFFPLKQFLG